MATWPRRRCAVNRAEEEEEDLFFFPSRNGISDRVDLAGCQVGFGQVSSSLYFFPVVVSFTFSSVFYFTDLNSNLFAGF
jgi:hypothetical protein